MCNSAGPLWVMRQTQVPERATHSLMLRSSVLSLRRQMREVFGEEADGILRPGLDQFEQSSPEQRADPRLGQKLSVALTLGRRGVRHHCARATLLRHLTLTSLSYTILTAAFANIKTICSDDLIRWQPKYSCYGHMMMMMMTQQVSWPACANLIFPQGALLFYK